MRVIRSQEIEAADELFRVLETTDRAQVALMVLRNGDVSGEFGTDHPQAEQILVVLEGGGSIRVGDEEEALAAGDVVVIPAGAPHQVRGPSRSLSVYSPVAYPDEA
jgi:mannose-6-phosphate isomerase-like protein (cupin superfamily)